MSREVQFHGHPAAVPALKLSALGTSRGQEESGCSGVSSGDRSLAAAAPAPLQSAGRPAARVAAGEGVFYLSVLKDNVDPFLILSLLQEDLKVGFYDISRQKLYGNELR